jgi:hypothetical protein
VVSDISIDTFNLSIAIIKSAFMVAPEEILGF